MTNFKIKDWNLFTIEKNVEQTDYPRNFWAQKVDGTSFEIKGIDNNRPFLVNIWYLRNVTINGIVYTDVDEAVSALNTIVYSNGFAPLIFSTGDTDEIDAANGTSLISTNVNTIAAFQQHLIFEDSIANPGTSVLRLSDSFLQQYSNFWSLNTLQGDIYNNNSNYVGIGVPVGSGLSSQLQVEKTFKVSDSDTFLDYFTVNLNGVFGNGGGSIFSNAAYGEYALKSNTTGQANTSVGFEALFSNTIGTWNVAVGTASMRNYVGPLNSQNAALGAYSMYLSTSGVGNTALGSSALQNHTTGNYNTAVGFHTLESRVGNLTGSNNIGLGIQAGRAVTSGSNNILIENTTNDGVTTGNNNIILDPVNRCGITTGSNNVVVGGFNGTLPTALADTMVFGTGNGVERFRVDNLGNFGIGTQAPGISSILDIVSTNKTLTIPRMTTAQQSSILTPSVGSLIYNTETNNAFGGFKFRDSLGWFNVKRNDTVDFSIITSPSLPPSTVRLIAHTGVQALGAGTISLSKNTTGSFDVNTGLYTNNTQEDVVVRLSGLIVFNSAAWTIGQFVDVYTPSQLFTRHLISVTGSYALYVPFSSQIVLGPGASFQIALFQNSASAKVISPAFTKIVLSTN